MTTKLIFDPIHKYIPVDPIALQIIDHPIFKRLKNIKQLTPDQSMGPFQIFNLATGQPQTLKKFIKIIENLTNLKFKKNLIPYQPGDIKDTYAETKKLRSKFKINSKITLEKGLSNFIDWYKSYYNIK